MCSKTLVTRRTIICTAVLLAVGFLLLYVLTAQRGVSWGDSGIFQLRIRTGDIAGRYISGKFGLVGAHPIYVGLCHYLSLCVPAAFRMWFINALGGVFAAGAVAMAFLCAWRLTSCVKAAALAALTFGCAHMTWWLSSMAEVYTLSLLFAASELFAALFFLRRDRLEAGTLLFLLNGLHFSVHNFALLSLPIYCALIGLRVGKGVVPVAFKTRRAFAGCLALGAVGGWLIGAAPMLLLAGDLWYRSGDFGATVASVLVGPFGGQVAGHVGVPFRVTLFNFGLAALSFALPCWVPGVRRLVGFLRAPCRLPPERLLLLALFAIHFLFWVRYRVADQATFLLPTLFYATMLLAPALVDVKRVYLWALGTLCCAIVVPVGVVQAFEARAGALMVKRAPLPFRDDLRYFAYPWKQDEDSAVRFMNEVARTLPAHAYVYVDFQTAGVFVLAWLDGRLPDTTKFSDCTWGGNPQAVSTTCWEVRPFHRYRMSPPDAVVTRRGVLYEVTEAAKGE